MSNVTQYFHDIGSRRVNSPIGDNYKIGWVGFRGSDKYDEPGLYGLEYRSISAYVNETNYQENLDRIQQSMMKDDYGIPKERIRRWLAQKKNKDAVSSAVASVWYNQDWADVLAGAAPEVKKALDPDSSKLIEKMSFGIYGALRRGWIKSPLAKRLTNENNRTELKMLVHDWSNDPLVFEDETFQKRIIAHQVRALARFQEGETINVLVSDFLVDSGLYAAVSNSIGPAGR